MELTTDTDWLVAKEMGLEFFCEPLFDFYNVTSLSERVFDCYRKNLHFENAIEVNSLFSFEEDKGMRTLIAAPAVRRPIPMMYFEQKDFADKFNDIYDAGKLTCGYVILKCRGKGELRITYAECMSFVENGKVKKRKRDDKNGVIIGNYDIITVNGECVFEPFWMRTFRYIEVKIQGDIEIDHFNYIETGYPLKVSEKYDFGNLKDNTLFDISVNTLKRCMHDSYMDCPYYEQLQYAMDTHLQMLFTYQLTEDKALPEKAIDDFAKSYRVGGITQSRFPTNKIQYIPGFSLIFIMMLYEHAKRFGDKAFLRKYIHIADGIIDWFVSRLDGYMVPSSNLWDFVDWVEDYNNGCVPTGGPIAVTSLMLSYSLEKLNEMHSMLGNSTPEYLQLSNRIKDDVKTRCFDLQKGLYADSPGKTHFSQHPQIWAVLCGMEKGDNARKILQESMKLTSKATSAYMFFWFRALEEAGIYELSEECMDSLRTLVDLGCTTTPEWIREDVRSECHAWSAVAIYEFTAKVLGVTFKDGIIRIEPYIANRKYAKGEVATPEGTVFCEWHITDGEFSIDIKLPDNKRALIKMPDGKAFEAGSGKYNCNI